MRILLDTNFMLLPVQFKLDIYEELRGYELITLDVCIKELKRLSRSKSKSSKIKVNIARELAKKVRIIESESMGRKSADKKILGYALENKCAVATNDKALIKSLKAHGIKIIRLRQRHLEEE